MRLPLSVGDGPCGRINYSLDTDHDGMPDDVELANGLDPNNPADADGDIDEDGLTNGHEFTKLQTLDLQDLTLDWGLLFLRGDMVHFLRSKIIR